MPNHIISTCRYLKYLSNVLEKKRLIMQWNDERLLRLDILNKQLYLSKESINVEESSTPITNPIKRPCLTDESRGGVGTTDREGRVVSTDKGVEKSTEVVACHRSPLPYPSTRLYDFSLQKPKSKSLHRPRSVSPEPNKIFGNLIPIGTRIMTPKNDIITSEIDINKNNIMKEKKKVAIKGWSIKKEKMAELAKVIIQI